MAAILAVAATDNWNSNGSWVGGVQPTAADDVTIVAGANVTIPTGVTALARSVTIAATGTVTFATTTSLLNIGDATAGASNVAFSNAGTITLTGIGVISFLSTSTTQQTITSGGQTMPSMTFNGAGGTWLFSDNMTATGAAIVVTAGTLNTGSKTISAKSWSMAGSGTRVVTFGSSGITLTNAGAVALDTGGSSNITYTANTAIFTVSGAAGTVSTGANWQGASIVFSGSGAQGMGGTAWTFANITRTGTAVKTDTFLMRTGTITGTLTLTGNTTQGVNRILMQQQSGVGTTATLTMTGGAVVITGDVDFRDIAISGAPSWTNTAANFVGDCGGNGSLITTNETVAATQTHTSSAGGNWSDATKWTSRVPLPQDNVIVNVNTTGTLTSDMPRLGANLTFTGFVGTWTNSVVQEMYGNIILGNGSTLSGTNTLTLGGRGSQTITSNSATFTQAISINASGGTYTLQDAFVDSRNTTALNISLGTFVDNGQTVTLTGASGAYTQTSGTLTKTGNWSFSTTSAVSFVAVTGGTVSDTGAWTLTATSANTRTFAGGGKTYKTLTYTVAGSTGQLNITGSNTFTTINFSDVTNARTLAFTAATTTTVTTFNVNGTSTKLMTVTSITAATHTLTSATQQSCDFLSVDHSIVDASPKWYAGANSTDGGSNTNWIFTAPPVTGNKLGLLGVG